MNIETKTQSMEAYLNGLSASVQALGAELCKLSDRVDAISPAKEPARASVEDMLRYSQNMVNLYGEWRMFGGHFMAKAHPTAMQYLDDTVKGLKEVMDDLIVKADSQLSQEKKSDG